MSIDEKLKKIEEYASQIEDENIGVEEAMDLFEKANQLSKECYEQLSKVKGRIFEVTKEMDTFKEKVTTKEFK